MAYEVVTDSSANLLDEQIKRFGLHVLPLTFFINDEEYTSYSEGEVSDLKRFYTMMREGKVITTSLPHLNTSQSVIKDILDRGNDVLYLGFSSGLSGTYESVSGLMDQMAPDYPDRKLVHVDTLAASMGEGLLVYLAMLKKEAGASIEEVATWVEENKLKCAHWFTVDDLMFLFRGGRVSRSAAWAGTMLNIKPVMHVNDEGHLIPLEKVRGRKKSIQGLFQHMKKTIQQPTEEQTVFISHGDCKEDVDLLIKLINTEMKVKDIVVNYVDPVIGAHSGPGTLALFFMASSRD